MDLCDCCCATLQVNANHIGKLFTTLCVRYIPQQVNTIVLLMSMKPHHARDTVTLLQREICQSSSPSDVATHFARFESGVSFKRGAFLQRALSLC